MTTEIPTEAVEVGAKALCVASGARPEDWPHEDPEIAAGARDDALAVLEAALPSLRHQWAEQVAAEQQAVHEDLRRILLALGLGDQARPYSSREVVQREVLPTLASLRHQWAQDLRVQINLLPTHDLDGLPIPPLDMRHAASDLVREFGETNP